MILDISIKWVLSAICMLIATIWLINKIVIDSKRDLHPVALQEQSNIAPVRKEHETAVYRNFTVPPGFPLTTGLGLSLGYKIRNGNFGDIWASIMSLSKGHNKIEFESQSHTLGEINSIAKQILVLLREKSPQGRVGIVTPVYTFSGFTFAIAGLMGSLEGIVPHFLISIPRQKMDLDVLVVDSWKSFSMMNGSHEWYKLVIVCDDQKANPNQKDTNNVLCLAELISNAEEDLVFDYSPPTDNSHDSKIMAYFSSPWNHVNSFTHMALVSSVAAFIKSFPIGTELTDEDNLSIVVEDHLKGAYSIQIWNKVLAVLLHGGSVFFVPASNFERTLNSKTTLLDVDGSSKLIDSLSQTTCSLWNRVKLSWSQALLSEGLFSSFACQSPVFRNLRCIYLREQTSNVQEVTALRDDIPKLKKGIKKTISSGKLNYLRALTGARAVKELCSPYVVMGPIAHTNFFDYRVFPRSVDESFAFYGSICTSLEAKLVDTDENPDLTVQKRQGMLCIRGFTIGRPVESERLERALKVIEKFDGGEGWMPMLGVFCVWGNDGCLYEYK